MQNLLSNLFEDIPKEYFPKQYDDSIALCVCPLCGHVTANPKKKATAFLEIDGRIAYKCFYCENGGKKGGTYHALNIMGLSKKYGKYLGKEEGRQAINFYSGYSPLQISSIDDESLKLITPIVKGTDQYEYLQSRKLEALSDRFLSYGNNILYPAIYNKKIYGGMYRVLPQSGEKIVRALITNKINNYFSIFRTSGIDTSKPIYVFEGAEDAVSSGKANSIALFGINVEKALRWFSNSTLVFCLDNDKVGFETMKRVYENYPDRFYFIAYNSDFGEYKDFNDRLRESYGFKDNSTYIDNHIIKNPIKFYGR